MQIPHLRARWTSVVLALIAASGGVAHAQPAPSAPTPAPAAVAPASPGFAPPPPGWVPSPPPVPAPSIAAPAPAAATWYPPPVYPQGYYPWYYAPQPYPYPPLPPRRLREPYSKPLVVAGILTTSLGTIALITGAAIFASAAQQIDVYCENPQPALCGRIDDNKRIGAGIATMVVGGVAAIGGIPLWIIGAKSVPVTKKDEPRAALFSRPSPELRIGAASIRIDVRF